MRPEPFAHPDFPDYALLDSGKGEKLERFGSIVLRRPDPQALWLPRRDPSQWERADLTFVRESDRGGRWERRPGSPERGDRKTGSRASPPSTWTVGFGGATFAVEPTPFKHVGLFPEQAANWLWTTERARELGRGAELLNLFAYTGVASCLAARAGFAVTHVDASKKSIAWARENARLCGLGEGQLRMVVDDALAFARREARRGRRYAGILLDPPHYGRGPKGETWQFEDDMAPLLSTCAELLAERSFLVLSTYAIGYSPLALWNVLADLPGLAGGEVEAGELALPEERPHPNASPRMLPCGFAARWRRGA